VFSHSYSIQCFDTVFLGAENCIRPLTNAVTQDQIWSSFATSVNIVLSYIVLIFSFKVLQVFCQIMSVVCTFVCAAMMALSVIASDSVWN